MSIATEITRLQTAKADIKQSIENQGASIPSTATLDTYSNYIAKLLDVGGKNPVLIKEYHEEIPFSETNFPNITPTTSQQAFYPDADIDTIDIDLENYDYVLYAKTKVEYIYTGEVPKEYSSFKKVIAETVKNFIRIDDDRIGYHYSADTQQTLTTNSAMCTYHKANNDINRTDMSFFSTGAFWINPPYGNFTNRNTQILLKRGTNYVRIDNNRMSKEAYELVDAENTKLIIDIKVYQVDKGTSPVGVWGQEMVDYVLGE